MFFTRMPEIDKLQKTTLNIFRHLLTNNIICGIICIYNSRAYIFEITVENLKKSKLTQIHTFPYSIRKGTIAEKLKGHLPDKVKEERASIIKKISGEKFEEFFLLSFQTWIVFPNENNPFTFDLYNINALS